jgi:hypothetical protein
MKAQDIVVLLKLIALGRPPAYAVLASQLCMSSSEVHAAMRRSTEAGLLDPVSKMPIRESLEEFLLHGLKYVYPPVRGTITKGMPTCYAAPMLSERSSQSVNELPPVWPDPKGTVKGYSLLPLYPSVTKAARQDKVLYKLLALVDVLREGQTKEQELATEQLKTHLQEDKVLPASKMLIPHDANK